MNTDEILFTIAVSLASAIAGYLYRARLQRYHSNHRLRS